MENVLFIKYIFYGSTNSKLNAIYLARVSANYVTSRPYSIKSKHLFQNVIAMGKQKK